MHKTPPVPSRLDFRLATSLHVTGNAGRWWFVRLWRVRRARPAWRSALRAIGPSDTYANIRSCDGATSPPRRRSGPPPGYRDDAVVRHFEAPGAVQTRFYEVRAKSVLNRVPEASQMPFRWTINPYRGCTHACAYCLAGDTRVLGVDGRETELRDLKVGDRIYGTRREGTHRRLVETEVLAKWASIRQAFRIELEDETELIASGDHRFLTTRGWKHVTGAEQGRDRRPHLTVGARMLGPGGSVTPPAHDEDYRRGYACAIVRGDANLARGGHLRDGPASDEVDRSGWASQTMRRFSAHGRS